MPITEKKLSFYLRLFAVCCLVLGLVLLFNKPLLRTMGNFLVVTDKLIPCDCIVVLAGEKGERVIEGVKLYQQGLANRMILSGGPNEAGIPLSEIMRSQAEALGVPPEAIYEENQSEDTGEDAYYTKNLMEALDFQSMILVTSPYHSRRAVFLFKKIFKHSGVKIISQPVTDSWYDPESWWQTKRGIKATGAEYLKFIWYHLFTQSLQIE